MISLCAFGSEPTSAPTRGCQHCGEHANVARYGSTKVCPTVALRAESRASINKLPTCATIRFEDQLLQDGPIFGHGIRLRNRLAALSKPRAGGLSLKNSVQGAKLASSSPTATKPIQARGRSSPGWWTMLLSSTNQRALNIFYEPKWSVKHAIDFTANQSAISSLQIAKDSVPPPYDSCTCSVKQRPDHDSNKGEKLVPAS